MVSVTGDFTDKQLKLAIDEALCSDALKAELTGSGFHFISFDVAANIAHLLSSEQVDTIIAKAQFSFFNLVRDLAQDERDKLLLLIVPDDDSSLIDPQNLDNVDAILPANPQYLIHQLSSMVTLHRKNHQLQSKIEKLEADIAAQ